MPRNSLDVKHKFHYNGLSVAGKVVFGEKQLDPDFASDYALKTGNNREITQHIRVKRHFHSSYYGA